MLLKIDVVYSIKTSVIISIICLNSCTNAGKTADCQKYWQVVVKNNQTPINIPKTEVKTKESTVKGMNAIANYQDEVGKSVGDLKFQEAKSQELQKKYISSSHALSQAFRDRANTIASLAGNPSETELKKILSSVPQLKSDAVKKWTQSNDDWFEYCKAYAP